jgi:hypothetical protein
MTSKRLTHAAHALASCCLLAGCVAKERSPPPTVVLAAPRAPAPKPVTIVKIRKVVEPCPAEAEIKRLRAARPRPLRDQKMPATAAERVATTAAQLGLYEAPGKWADQVDAALRACEGK